MAHPYKSFEGSRLWNVLEKTILGLQGNGDLQLTTRAEYVVGYLCRELRANDLVAASKSVAAKKRSA